MELHSKYTYTVRIGEPLVEVSEHGSIVGWINPDTGRFERVMTERETDAMIDAALKRKAGK